MGTMRGLERALWCTLLVTVAAPLPAAVGGEGPAPEGIRRPPLGTLTLEENRPEALAGWFAVGGTAVYFAARESAGLVEVRVEVNGLILEAARDQAKRQVRWSGQGGFMLPDDRRALRSMVASLGRLAPAESHPGAARELLGRALERWAEVSLGVPLHERIVPQPADADIVLGDASPRRSEPTGAAAVAKACQVDDDNGIWYFPNPCGSDWQVACYDAQWECWGCLWQRAGCRSNDCNGRCGPGCWGNNNGFRGNGVYTYDCLDHDACCRRLGGCANPWDGNCGDEFWDADDDFWWGRTTCFWGC